MSSPAHLAGVWEGDTDPGAVQGGCLPALPSLLWSLVLLLVQAHLFLPARWKEKQIRHGAHLDVLRQRLCCITNTCLPGLGEHPLNQQLRAQQTNSVYTGINQKKKKFRNTFFRLFQKEMGL